MGFANRAIVAAGLGFAVSALVGCGGSGRLLSAEQASRLSNELAQARQALANDQCSSAQNAISSFSASVDSLGAVNQTLVSNLEQGAQTIQELAGTDCRASAVTRPIQTRTTATTRTNGRTTTTNALTTTTATQTYTYTPPAQTQTDTVTTQTETDTIPTQTDTDTATTGTTTTNTNTTPSGGTGFGTTTTTSSTTTPQSGGVGPS